MNKLIELQPAYLLHSRPFRDSSLLLDFLTRDYGRVSAIARGARRSKAKNKALLQPFVPVQISLLGKNELKTLKTIELLSGALSLKGANLFSGLYINEIAVRLMHGHDSDTLLFDEYEKTLNDLSEGKDLEPVLRNFELNLLGALGYGVEFAYEADTGDEIVMDKWYYFQHESGFILLQDDAQIDKSAYFSGKELIAIDQRDFSKPETRLLAKRILRNVLRLHLGDKPLKSRQLFAR